MKKNILKILSIIFMASLISGGIVSAAAEKQANRSIALLEDGAARDPTEPQPTESGTTGPSSGTTQPTGSTKVRPTTIPCPKDFNLPCITEATQKTSGGVEKHVIEKFGVTFLTGFLGLVGITSVIFLIVGGLQMHLAFGNPEALTKAKKTLVWAIVGLIIAILSVALVRIISTLFEK